MLRPGDRVTVTVPNRWNGRFWGRTGCVFHGSNLPMYIYPTTGHATKKVSAHGCVPAGCTSSVRCPDVLKINYRGKYVA
ncbi:MAG: thaumatin family protein [Streptosporangiaceae bacterium]